MTNAVIMTQADDALPLRFCLHMLELEAPNCHLYTPNPTQRRNFNHPMMPTSSQTQRKVGSGSHKWFGDIASLLIVTMPEECDDL